jgi:AraC family transcriptional regulator
MLAHQPVVNMKEKDFQLIREIRGYLDDHLYELHSVQDICNKFTINREKLQAGFHELVQSTVHAYIVSQRMAQAAKRLLETDDSIKAIALGSGYKKQRSFNKTFKATFNLTPATFRRLQRKCADSQ